MKRVSMILLILFLLLGGYACGRSGDKSGVESNAKEEVQSLEQKASGEVKNVEEDYRTLEEEKDYKKALEEEPKAPPVVLEEGKEGDLSAEGFDSPPE